VVKAFWSRLGGQLGVAFCLLGFLFLFLGWNGAASRDRVPAQFPYVISGGLAGLALVIVGVGLLIVQNQRADRTALQESIVEVLRAMETAGLSSNGGGQARAEQLAAMAEAAGLVLAGRTAFHHPRCHLAAGREEVRAVSPEDALGEGLDPCRVCDPPLSTKAATKRTASTRGGRSR
jgi:hypothetical protein